VLERSCDRGLLEAAVDVTQCSFGFRDYGTGGTGFLELDAERAASGRPGGPGKPTAGFVQQRHHDATTG
jgi:hypothetical protein